MVSEIVVLKETIVQIFNLLIIKFKYFFKNFMLLYTLYSNINLCYGRLKKDLASFK